MKARFALKTGTDDIHRELDERLSRLDLSRADDYRMFLHFHGRTVPAVEAALDSAGLGDFVEGWRDHRRSPAIAEDLGALGATMPDPVDIPQIEGVSELLGTAYVLEGSRLGGRVLKRRVGKGLPSAFLAGSGSNEPWTHVIAALDRHLYSDQQVGEAARAARRCFALFLSAAKEAGL